MKIINFPLDSCQIVSALAIVGGPYPPIHTHTLSSYNWCHKYYECIKSLCKAIRAFVEIRLSKSPCQWLRGSSGKELVGNSSMWMNIERRRYKRRHYSLSLFILSKNSNKLRGNVCLWCGPYRYARRKPAIFSDGIRRVAPYLNLSFKHGVLQHGRRAGSRPVSRILHMPLVSSP